MKYRIVLLFLTLSFSTHLNAQGMKGVDPETSKIIDNLVGKVVLVKGQVTKVRADNKKEIKIGDSNQILQQGDALFTGETSLVKVQMIDDSVISLGPKSRLVFEKFSFKSKNDRQSIYGFVAGKVRANIPNKAKPGDLTFKTKTTALGVRGTIFVGNLNTTTKGNEVTQFAVIEGKVKVTNDITAENTNIEKKEKFVSITNGSESLDSGTVNMSEEEFAQLSLYDDAKIESEVIFLDDMDADQIQGKKLNSHKATDNYEESSSGKKSNWKDNLKKLNKKLDEYHGN